MKCWLSTRDDNPVQKSFTFLKEIVDDFFFYNKGPFDLTPSQVRIVAVGARKVATGGKKDTADFSGKVDERLLLKTAEYHGGLPISEIITRFYFATCCCGALSRFIQVS